MGVKFCSNKRYIFPIAAGQPVIYDATNFKRPHRIALLQKLAKHENVYWVALQVQTPVERCKIWNQQRQRQVPEPVIESMAQYLETFPLIPAEGFAAVYPVAPTTEDLQLQSSATLARAITNRKNRTKNITIHRYSRLLDFERLMHLIALLIRYPGIGNLQETSPQTLQRILGTSPSYGSALEEICALISHFHTSVYADSQEVAADLAFLDNSGMLGVFQADFDIPDTEYNGDRNMLVAHAYSDLNAFVQLLKTIRYIAQYPFLRAKQKNLELLLAGLKAHEIYTCRDTLRKDIELALKPYKILLDKPMRRGYFLGTGILAKHELKEVFKVLQSQAESLEDPIAIEIYQASNCLAYTQPERSLKLPFLSFNLLLSGLISRTWLLIHKVQVSCHFQWLLN